jgi:hypothetical protein
MENVYYNVSHPASFGGKKNLSLLFNDANSWLQSQRPYTLHAPTRRKFERRIYRAKYIDQFWQADLNEMIPYSQKNKGMKYILTVVDVLTRYGMALPLKDKSGKTLTTAFEVLFKDHKPPSFLHTDEGKEFLNKSLQQLLLKHNVKHFVVKNQIKAGIVERFNRTLKTKMFRYFTHIGEHKWVDQLQKFVDAYNNSIHRTIGTTPNKAHVNSLQAFQSQQRRLKHVKKRQKFKIGDYIRVSRTKYTFEKGYTANWSEEIFIIYSVDTKYMPYMYTLHDLNGEEVEGRYYEAELQKVKLPEVFAIEKILKRQKGKALVKFLGYQEPEWITTSNINNIRKAWDA